MTYKRLLTALGVGIGAGLLSTSAVIAQTVPTKPNIVIIWGDDIGQSNISAYSMG